MSRRDAVRRHEQTCTRNPSKFKEDNSSTISNHQLSFLQRLNMKLAKSKDKNKYHYHNPNVNPTSSGEPAGSNAHSDMK